MRRAPLLPIALSMIVGIGLAHTLGLPPFGIWLPIGAFFFVAIGVLLLFRHRLSPSFLYAAVILFCGSLSAFYAALSTPSLDSTHWSHHVGSPASLVVQLKESPSRSERSIRAKATVLSADGSPSHGDITLFFSPDSLASSLLYSDLLLLRCSPDTIHLRAFVPSNRCRILSRDSLSLRSRAERLRMHLVRRMQNGPLLDVGIPQALVLGYTANVDRTTRSRFQASGISHLLAVSGLHVGLVGAIIGACLRPFGRTRRARLLSGFAQGFAVWTFALLSGLSPATLRASLMFSLFIAADVSVRRVDGLNILALAAILMLAFRPLLLFECSWQLSFAAVGGIMLSRPALNLFHNRILKGAAVSVAATLATLPIVLFHFHQLPLYFLLSNTLILPVGGFLLVLSFLYLLFPVPLVSAPLSFILNGINRLTAFIQSLPCAVVQGDEPSSLALFSLSFACLLLLILPRAAAHFVAKRRELPLD